MGLQSHLHVNNIRGKFMKDILQTLWEGTDTILGVKNHVDGIKCLLMMTNPNI